MNDLIEKLLQPVSAEQPCGPDLSADTHYNELETLLKGKPEVEIGALKKPAEPPNWREVQDRSIEYLQKSKHLRVAMWFCGSRLQTGGLAGFLDGLQLVRGLVEQYWPAVYPVLDPEDNNDPTLRLNILKALTEPRGSLAVGWLAILEFLQTTPVLGIQATPAVTFDQLRAASQPAGGGAAAVPAELLAAFRDAGKDQIEVPCQIIQQSLESLRGLDQFLLNTLGQTNTISFDVLQQALETMLVTLRSSLTDTVGVSAEAVVPAPAAAGGQAEAATPEIKVKGQIRSSNDVVRALEQICDYYRQVEPSSPVPFLLRRAQKLARMDFVQAVQELNLATVDSLRPSMGSGLPADLSPGTPPAAAQ